MFVAFDINFNSELFFLTGDNKEHYRKKYRAKAAQVKSAFYGNLFDIIENKYINGQTIQRNWFPVLENIDVFLSHSHMDINDVTAFAGWLQENLGVKVFIDSELWGNIEELEHTLEELVNKPAYVDRHGKVYDYANTRRFFQHTNAMLSIALEQMMDAAEVMFFLNSNQSIPIRTNDSMNATYSPWIYTEIACSKILRRKPLICYRDVRRYRNQLLEESVVIAKRLEEDFFNYIIVHPLDLEHLIKLTVDDLRKLNLNYIDNQSDGLTSLDILYESKYNAGWYEFISHLRLDDKTINKIRGAFL